MSPSPPWGEERPGPPPPLGEGGCSGSVPPPLPRGDRGQRSGAVPRLASLVGFSTIPRWSCRGRPLPPRPPQPSAFPASSFPASPPLFAVVLGPPFEARPLGALPFAASRGPPARAAGPTCVGSGFSFPGPAGFAVPLRPVHTPSALSSPLPSALYTTTPM